MPSAVLAEQGLVAVGRARLAAPAGRAPGMAATAAPARAGGMAAAVAPALAVELAVTVESAAAAAPGCHSARYATIKASALVVNAPTACAATQPAKAIVIAAFKPLPERPMDSAFPCHQAFYAAQPATFAICRRSATGKTLIAQPTR